MSERGHALAPVPKEEEAATVSEAPAPEAVVQEEARPLTEEELKERAEQEARKEVAEQWLKKDPKKGVVRYTFRESGPLGLRFSKDVPPWILEVRDGSLAAKKAPRVPVAGIVLAVNGYELSEKDCTEAMQALKKRPVILDVEWPIDQGV